MIAFIKKFENRGIKIAQVDSVLSLNLSIYNYLLLFCMVWGPLWFKESFRTQSIYREVHDKYKKMYIIKNAM